MRNFLPAGFGAGAAMLLAVLPAQAADTAADDFHCLVVGTLMGSAENPQIQSVGLYITLYYMGRLDGAGKTIDLKSNYKAEFAKIKPENMDVEAKACGTLLTARGASLTAMLEDAVPKPDGAKPADKPAPDKQAPDKPTTPAPEKPAP